MSDDEGQPRNGNFIPRPIKVEGELLISDLPPIEELQITVPEQECVKMGSIQSIVGQMVLVSSNPGAVPLNVDTVLFLDKGTKPLGKIFDVIGQVSDPLYCVLFNTNEEIVTKGIKVGDDIYCAPNTEHTSFIILSDLMRNKGSDASWKNDCEPPERYLDYSDDEKERSARKNRVGYRVEGEVINVDADHTTRPKHNRHSHGQAQRRPFRRTRGGFNPNYRHQHPNAAWNNNFVQQPYNVPPAAIYNPFAVQAQNLYVNPFAMPPPPPPPQ
jgi:H/ACA ribonucleoprotein complex non-core subunit NAF1